MLIVSPILVSISGSQSTEYISPMIGSTVLYGNRTSSTLPVIHPETVTIRLTRLLLCRGLYSKVFTAPVLRFAARTAITPPEAAAPDVMIAAPPAPARKPLVPATPIVVKPAARPAPITGASKPADRPITKPPPTVARPIIKYLFFKAIFLRFSLCSSSFQFSFSAACCISNASVTRFSNRQISSHETSIFSPTFSSNTLDRASYTESAISVRNRSQRTVHRKSISRLAVVGS